MGSSTVPPTTILALFRNPSSRPAAASSHPGAVGSTGTSASAARVAASLATSCSAYGTGSWVHERHTPASK